MQQPFVAINYIQCTPAYAARFEELFGTRAKAIDTMPGFQNMHVLKPNSIEEPYLVVSYWDSEADFKQWTTSSAFLEGHKRAFADMAAAKAEGKIPPMHSSFKTYSVIAN